MTLIVTGTITEIKSGMPLVTFDSDSVITGTFIAAIQNRRKFDSGDEPVYGGLPHDSKVNVGDKIEAEVNLKRGERRRIVAWRVISKTEQS